MSEVDSQSPHRSEDERLAANAKALGNCCVHPWDQKCDAGISIRHLFAAMAMQGLRADGAPFLSSAEMARKAVADADALLQELSR